MGLVHQAAHRRGRSRHLLHDDLVQAGAIGLMRGIEKFDPARGVEPSTYLSYWIRASINRAVANADRAIRVPVHRLESAKRRDERLPVEFSIDAPLLASGSGPDARNMHDVLAGACEAPDDAVARERDALRLEAALATLPDRSQRVLRRRFWGDMTLLEVGNAEVKPLSRERIRQIERDALAALRRALAS